MLKKFYNSWWEIIDPTLYTVGACGSFGFWLAVF